MAAILAGVDTAFVRRRDHGWCTDPVADNLRCHSVGVSIFPGLSWGAAHAGSHCCSVPAHTLLGLMNQLERSGTLLGRGNYFDGVHLSRGRWRGDAVVAAIMQLQTHGFVERHRGGHETCHALENDSTRADGNLDPWDLDIGRTRMRRWRGQPSERMESEYRSGKGHRRNYFEGIIFGDACAASAHSGWFGIGIGG